MNEGMVTIPRPFDAHVHLRQPDGLMPYVLPFTAKVCSRAVVMPNTTPPILTGEDACRYSWPIERVAAENAHGQFEPLMAIYLTAATTPEMIVAARECGVVAAKWYPKGATTNSAEGLGVHQLREALPTLRAMAACGMVLSVHAEDPSSHVFCLDRESGFIGFLRIILHEVPSLKVVVEHVTSAEMVRFVLEAPDTVAATVTVHHLLLTLDDVVGIPAPSESDPAPKAALRPHNFCLPIAKRHKDISALRDVVGKGNSKFFLGSDSAPHLRSAKEGPQCAAGIFSAPVLLPLLAEIFLGNWWQPGSGVPGIEGFTSRFGEQFYGLPPKSGTITLIREPWVVPMAYPGGDDELSPGSSIVPFWAGRTLSWKVA